MHILFLTWKDIKHPHAGGAERVMYEYARRLGEKGHQVTWFASSFLGADMEDHIEGIKIIRKYTNHTIWFRAWWWYIGYKKNHKIDIIIDEAGGWPLLSPLYEKNIPIFFFTHHIGEKEFDAYSFPLSYGAKKLYHSLFHIYKKVPTIAVSQSTKNELVEFFGFSPSSVTVIENTTEIHPIEKIDFSRKKNDFVFLGRLTSIKHPDDAVGAFSKAIHKLPEDSMLHIIGNVQDQKYVEQLHALVKEKGVKDRVIFHGHMKKEEFSHILSQSLSLLVPSEKEGYGLVVLEANAHGIPVIGYDVSGLRDSVYHGRNGILVPYRNIDSMSQAMIDLLENREKYHTLCQSSLDYVRNIPTWDEQVEKFQKTLFTK